MKDTSRLMSLRSTVVRGDIENVRREVRDCLEIARGAEIIVTGASGFIGSNLCLYLSELSKAGDLKIKVIGLVRSIERLHQRIGKEYLRENSNTIEVRQYNTGGGFNIGSGARFVVHAASNADPQSFQSDAGGTCLANTLGTIESLKYAIKGGVQCYLYFSTSGIYGHVDSSEYPLREDSYGSINCTRPENIYLLSKKMGECLVYSYGRRYSLPFNVVRPSIVYGPGLDLRDVRSVPAFLYNSLCKDCIEILSDGKATRNYMYIRDFIEGVIIMLMQPEQTSFNLASSVDTQILELAKQIDSIAQGAGVCVRTKNTRGKNAPERVEFKRTSTNMLKFERVFGLKEETTLEVGLRNTIKHYQDLIDRTGIAYGGKGV